MELSKKKEDELFGAVHEEIFQTRMKIWKMRFDKNVSIHEIDNLLSDLCRNAPQSALNVFKNKIKK